MATPTPSKTTKANTIFSLDLFKKLSEKDKTANIFYSPFSISSTLAMVMLGTGGKTATQMSEVLGFTERGELMPTGPEQTQGQGPTGQNNEEDIHTSFAQLLNEINKEDASYTLSVANRLYGEKTFEFLDSFLAQTNEHYKAVPVTVDFINSAEAARVDINTWVEQQTQGKIKDLLAKGVLDAMTKMVLVNAIYFKGNWNKKFKEDDTVDAQFRVNKNDTKTVKMMRQKSEFHVANIAEVNSQILEMPYVKKDLSMLIFLPAKIEDDTTGLEKLESMLTYEKLVEWTRPNMMSEIKVEVSLPRFEMELTYALKDILISMGMEHAFDATRGDFSGMSTGHKLSLSKVIHKSYVGVNEEGTEAASATGAVVGITSVEAPVVFKADHPFLFFIRHNPSKSILFAGRCCSPE